MAARCPCGRGPRLPFSKGIFAVPSPGDILARRPAAPDPFSRSFFGDLGSWPDRFADAGAALSSVRPAVLHQLAKFTSTFGPLRKAICTRRTVLGPAPEGCGGMVNRHRPYQRNQIRAASGFSTSTEIRVRGS